ncbi:MAG: hypothetical protein CMC18_08990 [Flavobacteriaceae bacterium]|nr:hypothetical protein [Flavobacteriaceae bacterium]
MAKIDTVVIIGLGVMGNNLALNFLNKKFRVIGYDIDSYKRNQITHNQYFFINDLNDLKAYNNISLAVFLMLPADKISDETIATIFPLLHPESVIIDGGNSHFKDSIRRVNAFYKIHYNYLGVGISGGAQGALQGPSMMIGGNETQYNKIKHLFEAIGASFNGTSCARYVGASGAGHFVKMIHNGIEYALMQSIAEVYALLKTSRAFTLEEIAELFKTWQDSELDSYLLRISAKIISEKEQNNSVYVLDQIKDQAKHKGTGKWVSKFAFDAGVSISGINAALESRFLSSDKRLRTKINKVYNSEYQLPLNNFESKDILIQWSKQLLEFNQILSFAQGIALIQRGSEDFSLSVKLTEVLTAWMNGCIIEGKFVSQLHKVYTEQPSLEHLLLENSIAQRIEKIQKNSRKLVALAISNQIPLNVSSNNISYFDYLKTLHSSANLIQAQRDFFGQHGFERIDQDGEFHLNTLF